MRGIVPYSVGNATRRGGPRDEDGDSGGIHPATTIRARRKTEHAYKEMSIACVRACAHFFGASAIVLSVDDRDVEIGDHDFCAKFGAYRGFLMPRLQSFPGAQPVWISRMDHGFWSGNYVESQQRDT